MFFESIENYPLIIAHRGARSLAPENSLLAAKKAIDAGADAWEIDVQLSADLEPVVIHDNTLERTTNVRNIEEFSERGPWFVHEFTFEELRALDFGDWFNETDPFGQIAAGAVTEREQMIFRNTPLLILSDALGFTNVTGLRINVEIKDLNGLPGDEVVVRKVAEMVRELKMADKTLISSSNPEYLRQVKAFSKDMATGLIVETAHPDPVKLLRDLGADAYHPCSAAIDFKTVSLLRDKGFFVNIWTLNDMASAERFVKAGATGIFTDFPQKLSGIRTLLPDV